MTDISIINSLLPGTTQAQQAATAGETIPSAQTQTGSAGAATMPEDSVEISKEAMAAAYDQAYTQANMGQLYSDDTVAGTAYLLSEQAKQAGVTQGSTMSLDTVRQQMLAGRLSPEARAALAAAIEEWTHGADEKYKKEQEFDKKYRELVDENIKSNKDILSRLDDIKALYKEYGKEIDLSGTYLTDEGTVTVTYKNGEEPDVKTTKFEKSDYINNIYASSDAQQGWNKAIDYALKQHGYNRSQVADIDLNQAFYDGTVHVTFNDGSGPIDLGEDYVTHFAVKLLREQNKDKWDATLGQFDTAYAATLDKLGLQRSDVVGWSVKTDGKFHLFALNATGDGYDEQAIDDKNLIAAALAQSKASADQLRLAAFNGLSWASNLARRMS